MRRRAAALIRVSAILPLTKRRSLSTKAIVCCLIFFLIHSGCATSPKSPTPPSSEERDALWTVGVARAYHLPETEVNAA